jgi:serine/threonine protein kinase
MFKEINPETNKPRKKYIVMEQGYGDMGQLLDFVGGTLPEKAVKFYAAQILLGLEYLHSTASFIWQRGTGICCLTAKEILK